MAIAALVLVLGCDAAMARASSTPPEPAPRIGGEPAPQRCVQVDVAGHKAGHLDCATQALEAAARRAQGRARAGLDAPVPGTGSADTTLGIASLPGSRLRMGDALGRSVHPQRPHRIVPAGR